MSNIKKIIGVVLALVMALSVATIAFAADSDAYSISVTADKTTLEAGESATVTVKLTTNFYASAISIPVFFDKTQVTVSAGETTVADASVVNENSLSIDKIYEGAKLSPDDYAVRALVLVADWGNAIKKYSNETVMAFTVTANDGASGTVVLECVSASVKTTANPSGSLYVGKNSSGNATVDSLAETVNNCDITAATATINLAGAVAEPELILTATGEEYGTTIRKDLCTTDYAGCVYGIDTIGGESIEDYVTTASGSIEVLPNEESGEFTTGATILLKNNAGDVVATYVFIYFGDVNGDGAVDISDAGDVEAHDQWVVTIDEDTAAYYSADVNGDGSIDISDAGDIEAHDQWLVTLEAQNVLAENFNASW